MKFQPGLVPTLVTLGFLVLLISLGSWQLSREREKLGQALDHQEGQAQAVVKLDSGVNSLETFLFRRVEITGQYDDVHQFLLDNRTHNGVAGYFVLTPLLLGDAKAILVNRGWVPVGPSREVTPAVAVQSVDVFIEGRVAKAPRVFLLGEDGYARDGWPRVVQSVDYEAMSDLLRLTFLEGIVNLDRNAPDGYVREWVPFVGIPPERHRAYAVQWFSLAVTLMILYVFFGFRRRGEDNS